jgi:hypothetical protein
MNKKVTIGTKPNRTGREPSADAWVERRQAVAEDTMKRFTIDVSARLHARIKAQCALRGEKMADVIRAMLEERFPEQT